MVIVWNSLISDVKVPIAVLGAEIDEMAPPELLKQFEQVLSTKPEVGIKIISLIRSLFFCSAPKLRIAKQNI